jgi:hypothetical protein
MEQPVISQESAQTEAPAETVEDPDQALVDQITETESIVPEEVEEEHEGLKVRGKKEQIERWKSERLMQADYTRKTQEVAAQRQMLQQQAQFNQQFLDEAATLRALELRLAEYDKLDWRSLVDQDATQAQKLQLDRNDVARQRDQVAQSLHAKQAQTFQQQQAQLAGLREQAAAFLSQHISGWSPERDAAVAQYVVKQGVPAAAVSNVMMHMPQFGVMAHKAELYDALVAKATKKPPPAPQEAPVTRIAATRATASKDPSQMSDAEFAQWRKRQIAQRR